MIHLSRKTEVNQPSRLLSCVHGRSPLILARLGSCSPLMAWSISSSPRWDGCQSLTLSWQLLSPSLNLRNHRRHPHKLDEQYDILRWPYSFYRTRMTMSHILLLAFHVTPSEIFSPAMINCVKHNAFIC
ncbi:hypothetical protein TNCV_5078021 [Trichonephila clavipes]|uniref:Uncharacterized protein n=1 Tax=Trichonephila clavipes TaxID=2585209 RepID=A0A8X6RW73_TRICX|nr:hypothetical protein TNCV_5078021 [Trichonephila clavipes]